MKKLKTKSLCKILLLIILVILINNIYLYFLLSIYLIVFYRKYLLFFLTFIIILNLYNNNDFINIGFIDEVKDDYVIVNKILYKCKLYDSNYVIGDVIYSSSSEANDNTNELINNIRFAIKNKTNFIYNNRIKSFVYQIVSRSDNSDLYKNIFYNIKNYDLINSFEYVSLSYSFYYLLIIVFRKNKKYSLILMIIYSIIFGFQTKFILFFINYILSYCNNDKIEKTLIKILIITSINRYFLQNYSFIYGLFISVLLLSNKSDYNYLYIALTQSFLFGSINVFNCLMFKYFIYEKVLIFLISIYSLIFNNNLIRYIINILNSISSYFSFTIRGKISIILLIFIVFFISKIQFRNKYIKLLISVILCVIPYNSLITHINFIDVGQGDSILINDSYSFKKILIDTGSEYNYYKLKRELYNEGIYTIDYLIITHNDSDHNGNLFNLQKDFNIKKIIYRGEDILTNRVVLKYIDLDSNTNDNDSSLVYLLDIDNYRVLFTGDISSNIENNIIFKENINDIDILKVSHHGSNTASSQYFIGSIKPEFAVISTSGMYGHPHKNVLETLNKFNVNTFITKNDGCIKFIFTKLFDYIKTDNNRFVIISK